MFGIPKVNEARGPLVILAIVALGWPLSGCGDPEVEPTPADTRRELDRLSGSIDRMERHQETTDRIAELRSDDDDGMSAPTAPPATSASGDLAPTGTLPGAPTPQPPTETTPMPMPRRRRAAPPAPADPAPPATPPTAPPMGGMQDM